MKLSDLDYYSLPELWQPVDGFPNYEVSDHGRVRSIPRGGRPGRILKPNPSGAYLTVDLSVDGYRYERRIHRMVAEAFWPNPDDLPLVRHLDGNSHSNHFLNLEWGSYADNMADARKHGTRPTADHGSNSRYLAGCTCRPCKDAHRDVSRARRAKLKGLA